MNHIRLLLAVAFSGLPLLGAQETYAQQQDAPARVKPSVKPLQSDSQDTTTQGVDQRDREQRLTKYLSGAKFVGKFTVDGKDDATPKTEEYTISKCEKLPEQHMFRLTARIKYGDVDNELPLDLKILWSGNTPVITLDSFWIPGMGTFSARVLVHSRRYAGTWQHDAVGGHLFGKIVKD